MTNGKPHDNIIFIPKCFYKTSTFQHSAKWFVGKWVKVGFRAFAPEEMEYMWVKVETNTRWRLTGRLDNDPLFATYLRCGDQVTFRPCDVVAVQADD